MCSPCLERPWDGTRASILFDSPASIRHNSRVNRCNTTSEPDTPNPDTVPLMEPSDVPEPFRAPDAWRAGDILLDEYRVIKLLGKGGMGRVYLVETQTPPPLKYAVKILNRRCLQKNSMKRLFLRELQNWIDLQSHPHIIRCRFFKTIDNQLAIFSEYTEAGSLKQWIRDGKTRSLQQILDIAIQTAWGLEAAHRRNIVHLDMKPENILMTTDGTAKLTDFGISMLLAPVQPDTSHPAEISPGKTPAEAPAPSKKHSTGMTPAYASPEQFDGGHVTLQSDVWSWAVSVLEMFVGRVTWRFGFMAGHFLESTMREDPTSAPAVIPKPLYRILKRCFANTPEDRWPGMAEIAVDLQQVWSSVFNTPYPREKPRYRTESETIKPGTADPGDTARWKNASEWLTMALDISEIHPSMIRDRESVSRQTKEARAVSDLETLDDALKIFRSVPDDKAVNAKPYIARLLADKAAIYEYLGDHTGAVNQYLNAIEAHYDLVGHTDNVMYRKDMAGVIGNLANLLYTTSRYDESLKYQREAIGLIDDIVNADSPAEWINMQARLYYNIAVTYFGLKQNEPAANHALKSVAIRENLVFNKNRLEFIENLIQSYATTATILYVSEQFQTALDYFDKAVDLIRRSSAETGTSSYARHIAIISQSKAMTLRQMKQFERALVMYEASDKILTSLANQNNDITDLQHLSINCINRGNLYKDMGRIDDAGAAYVRGIKIMQQLVHDRGHLEFRPYLEKALKLQADLQQFSQ